MSESRRPIESSSDGRTLQWCGGAAVTLRPTLDVVEELIDLCAATGDAAAAAEWCREGIDVAETAGDDDSRDALVERCARFESTAIEAEE